MLIVIEGLDGAGKSTQVKMMREYLEKRCPRLEYIHFPRYDAPVYGGLIGKFLRGGFGEIDKVHPQLVALLFAEDRHGAAEEIKRVLASGGTVLLDRYVYSNIAYQCAKMPTNGGFWKCSRFHPGRNRPAEFSNRLSAHIPRPAEQHREHADPNRYDTCRHPRRCRPKSPVCIPALTYMCKDMKKVLQT